MRKRATVLTAFAAVGLFVAVSAQAVTIDLDGFETYTATNAASGGTIGAPWDAGEAFGVWNINAPNNPFGATMATARDSLLGGSMVLLGPALVWSGVLFILVLAMSTVNRITYRIVSERLM